MASQGGTSRLAQMQMRFHQKQQQEREQRKLEMTGSKLAIDKNGTTSSATSSSTSTGSITNNALSSSFGAGKVRQMFDERRRGAGIDRSYPLKPIATKIPTPGGATATTVKSTSKIGGGITSTIRKQPTSTNTAKTSISNRKSIPTTVDLRQRNTRSGSDLINGNTVVLAKPIRINQDNLDDETFPNDLLDGDDKNGNQKSTNLEQFSSMSLDDTYQSHGDSNNNNLRADKLKPVVIKKKTLPVNSPGRTLSARSNVSPLQSPSSNNIRRPIAVNSPAVKTKPKSPQTPTAQAPAQAVPTVTRPTSGPEGTIGCTFCGRFFNADRIEKHENVCNNSLVKKRKIFDAALHRVKGTEAEKYVKPKNKKSLTAKTSPTAAKLMPEKKSNWRQKHEEFIAAIRAAKEIKTFLAKGGKLKDLPPPPPSENPDYVTCPHCSRRFNESAATRHIPKCATMLHNKPKPGSKAGVVKRK